MTGEKPFQAGAGQGKSSAALPKGPSLIPSTHTTELTAGVTAALWHSAPSGDIGTRVTHTGWNHSR